MGGRRDDATPPVARPGQTCGIPAFHLEHPSRKDVAADCGFDHAVAFFVTVFGGELATAEYDRLQAHYADLEGALLFLVRHGFFTEEQLVDAKLALANEVEAPTDPGVLSAMTVVLEFKRAAD